MTITYNARGQTARPFTADSFLIHGFIIAAFNYILLFNLMDDGLRITIAGFLGLIAMARCILSWPGPAAQFATLLFIGLVLVTVYPFIFLLDPRLQAASLYAELSFRLLTGFAIFLFFVFSPRIVSPALLLAICITTLAVAALVALTFPPVIYAQSIRPAMFTGGAHAAHSTAYAVTAAFLGAITLWRAGWLSTKLLSVLGPPLFVLILLYQVRTCWFMIITYAAVTALIRFGGSGSRGFWLAITIIITTAPAVLVLSTSYVDYAEVTSGRTQAYAERLQMIMERPMVDIISGTGAGSNLMTTSAWWWDEKNSHNDFIDIVIQTGIFGLALSIALLGIAFANLDKIQLPLFASYVISSMLSNGLMSRPFLAAMLLAFMTVRAGVPAMVKERSEECGPICPSF